MYLVASNGTQYGPYSIEQINQMLVTGQLKVEDVAWTQGMAEWQPIHTLEGVRIPVTDPYAPRQAMGAPGHPGGYAAQGYGAAPWGYQAPQSTSGAAVTSMVLGILAILLILSIIFGAVAGVAAVVVGHIARSGINRSQGRIGGGGMALAGLICGYTAIALSGVMLLMAGAAVGYASIMERGRNTKMEGNIAILESYIQTYTIKNNGQPPSQAVGLRALVTKRIMSDDSLLTDPWGEPVEYKVPPSRSSKKYDVWSKGPDRISGNEDDIGNWESLD